MVNKHKAQGNFSFQIKLLIRKAHGLQRMRDTLVQTSLRIFTYNRKTKVKWEMKRESMLSFATFVIADVCATIRKDKKY